MCFGCASLSELVPFKSGPDAGKKSFVNDLNKLYSVCRVKCVKILIHPDMYGERMELERLDNIGKSCERDEEMCHLG